LRWYKPSERPLKIKSEYLGAVPRPTPQEYAALEADMLEKGYAHTPIYVNKNGIILDGHTRYKVCVAYDLWFSVIVKAFSTELEEFLFVIGCNLNRRQLTPFQRVELCLKSKSIIAEMAKQKQVEAGRGCFSRNQEKLEPVHTDEILAKRAGVSKDTLYKAERILEEGSADEIVEARSGVRLINRVYNKVKRRLVLEEAHRLGTPEMPMGLFDVIYADPPWRFSYGGSERGKAENHYATMSIDEICKLAVPVAEDAVLFLWVPNALLPDGFRVLEAWGFRYVSNFAWVKDRVGLGFYLRNQHELLLMGKRGDVPPPMDGCRFPSVIEGARGRHSAKPLCVYGMVENMYPGRRYLELFSRIKRDGWTMWGLEA
jgi:N6-adenosine-specific RNA methylase IME4